MKTVLILEDEPDVMKLLRRMLKNYSLSEAATAESAIRIFHDSHHKIDLLLADLTLPTSSGIQVALLLRGQLPNLPVILTSGYSVGDWSARDAADLASLGSNHLTILEKPFHPQLLSNAIHEMIGSSPGMAKTA